MEDEEALANSGAFTLSNPLVRIKDEGKTEYYSVAVTYKVFVAAFSILDAAGNPLYLTPDELNEFEQQQ